MDKSKKPEIKKEDLDINKVPHPEKDVKPEMVGDDLPTDDLDQQE